MSELALTLDEFAPTPAEEPTGEVTGGSLESSFELFTGEAPEFDVTAPPEEVPDMADLSGSLASFLGPDEEEPTPQQVSYEEEEPPPLAPFEEPPPPEPGQPEAYTGPIVPLSPEGKGLTMMKAGIVQGHEAIPGSIAGIEQAIAQSDEPLVPPQAFPPYWLAQGAEAVLPESRATDIYTGELEGVANVLSGFTSPNSIAMLAAGGGIGGVAAKLMAGGFSAIAAAHAPEQWRRFNAAETYKEKAAIATETIAGIGLPLFGLKGKAKAEAKTAVDAAIKETLPGKAKGRKPPVTYVPPLKVAKEAAGAQQYETTKTKPDIVSTVPTREVGRPEYVTEENWPQALAYVKNKYGGTKPLTEAFNKWIDKEGVKFKDPQMHAGQMQEFVRKIIEEPDDVVQFLPKPAAAGAQAEIPYSGGMTYTEQQNLMSNAARDKPMRPKSQIEQATGIRPVAKIYDTIESLRRDMVTKAEAFKVALRMAEEAAKKAGKSARETLRQADKWLEADRAAIRAKLLAFSKYLPLHERAKFLPAITAAMKRAPLLSKDPGVMYRRAEDVLNRMTEKIYDQRRRDAVSNIQKLINKVEASKSMNVTEKEAFMQRAKTFNQLKDKMSLTMLEEMQARMSEIATMGKDMFHLSAIMERERTAAILREIEAQGSVKVDNVEQAKAARWEAQRYWKHQLNGLKKLPSMIRNFRFNTRGIDWVIQIFDKGQSEGAIYRTVRLPSNIKYGEFLTLENAYKKRLANVGEKYKLHEGDYEKIGVHAELRQEGGEANLRSKGYTTQELNEAKTLTRPQLEWLREADKINNELFPMLKDTLAQHFNQGIEKTPGYFPRQRDWDWYNSLSVEEGKFARAFNRTNTEQGFTVGRTGAVTKNITNAQEIMMNHIGDVLYHIKMGPEVRRLANVVKDERFKAQVGEVGQALFSDWVDVLARQGGLSSSKRLRVVDKIVQNVGMGTLAFRLTTIGLQPLSLIQGMALVNPKSMSLSLNRMTTLDPVNRNWVINNFPEVKFRVGDDPAFGVFRGTSVRDTLGKVGYAPITTMDRFAAITVADAAYRDHLTKRGIPFDMSKPDQAAIQYAQMIVRKTQSSAYPKDIPLALSHGNLTGNITLNKALFQFQNFIMNRWALLEQEGLAPLVKGKGAMTKAQGARVMAFLVLGTIAEQLSRDGIKRTVQAALGSTDQQERDAPKNSKEYVQQAATKAGIDFLTSAPGVTNIAGMINYGGSGIPTIDTIMHGAESVGLLWSGKKPETRIAAGVRVAQSVGALAGAPVGQAADFAVQAIKGGMRDYHRQSDFLFIGQEPAVFMPPIQP